MQQIIKALILGTGLVIALPSQAFDWKCPDGQQQTRGEKSITFINNSNIPFLVRGLGYKDTEHYTIFSPDVNTTIEPGGVKNITYHSFGLCSGVNEFVAYITDPTEEHLQLKAVIPTRYENTGNAHSGSGDIFSHPLPGYRFAVATDDTGAKSVTKITIDGTGPTPPKK